MTISGTDMDDEMERRVKALESYSDPAPDPVAIATERTTQHVGGMTSMALDELRKQRDETDALMEAVTKYDRLLQSAINEHAQRVTSVIQSKVVIIEQLEKLRELFAPVTPVLTQLNGGGQK